MHIFIHGIFLGGYYIYTEASAPAKPGHKAQLISPNVQPGGQGQMCLTFWYFMYGRNVDNLNVYVQAGLVLPSQPVWKRSGTQGLQWQMATVNIRSRSVFNVSHGVSLSTVKTSYLKQMGWEELEMFGDCGC